MLEYKNNPKKNLSSLIHAFVFNPNKVTLAQVFQLYKLKKNQTYDFFNFFGGVQ